MKKEIKDIIRNSFYLYLIQGLNYLLPLLTLPFLIVKLSTDSFGKYSFAFAFSQFLILFVDFGFNLTATKKIAENAENHELIKRTFWNILGIKFVFFIGAGLVTFLLTLTIDQLFYYRTGIWISLITVFGTVLFPIWWFQGLNKMKLLSVINASSKLLTFPFIFVFVKDRDDANIAIFLQSSSMLLAGIFSIIYIFKKYKHYFKGQLLTGNQSDYIAEIKTSWPIFLSNSAISLYTNSLTIMLGLFSTPYSVGLFGAMERVVRVVCFGVLGPISQACFPLLARLKQTDFTKAKRIFRTILLSIMIIMSFVFISFYILEDLFVQYFFKGYNDAEQLLLLLFMTMIFPIALGGICGQLGLLALGDDGHKKQFAKIYIYVGLLSIPISITSIYYFDVHGAVYSMMSVEMTIFIFLFYLVKKNRFI